MGQPARMGRQFVPSSPFGPATASGCSVEPQPNQVATAPISGRRGTGSGEVLSVLRVDQPVRVTIVRPSGDQAIQAVSVKTGLQDMSVRRID